MSIKITNHAIVRYLERKKGLDLSFYKEIGMSDTEIVWALNLDSIDIKKEIAGEGDKVGRILSTIGGHNIVCKIGVGRSHKLVFCGSIVLTVLSA